MASPAHSLSSTQHSIGQDSVTSSPWDSRRVPRTPSIRKQGAGTPCDQSVPKTPETRQQAYYPLAITALRTATTASEANFTASAPSFLCTPSRDLGYDDAQTTSSPSEIMLSSVYESNPDQLVPSTPYSVTRGSTLCDQFSEPQRPIRVDESPPMLLSEDASLVARQWESRIDESSGQPSPQERLASREPHASTTSRRRLSLDIAADTNSDDSGGNLNEELPAYLDMAGSNEGVNNLSIDDNCFDERMNTHEDIQCDEPLSVDMHEANMPEGVFTSLETTNAENSNANLVEITSSTSNAEIGTCSGNGFQGHSDIGARKEEVRENASCLSVGPSISETAACGKFNGPPRNVSRSSLRRISKWCKKEAPKCYDGGKRQEIERRISNVRCGCPQTADSLSADGNLGVPYLFEDEDIFG